MTPEGQAFFARLNAADKDLTKEQRFEKMVKDEEPRMALAQQLADEDPRLNFISAVVIAGDRLSAERSTRWVEEGLPAVDAVSFVGSFGRLSFVADMLDAGKLDREWVLSEWPDLWRGADPDDTSERFLRLWYEAWERNGYLTILDDPDKPLPEGDVLTVYRGQDADAPLGMAWSLDKATADKFAHGAGTRQANRGGSILTGTVAREDVIAYLTGRGESEVVVDPDAVRLSKGVLA